jgi:hypothetical protein
LVKGSFLDFSRSGIAGGSGARTIKRMSRYNLNQARGYTVIEILETDLIK